MAGSDPVLRRQGLDRAINGILAGIGIQFFLGMWLNLFGSFPSMNSSFGGALTEWGEPLLALHAILGILLLIGTISILVLALRDPLRSIRWFALGGLGGILLAGIGGLEFVFTGYTNPYPSFLMAVGFGIALTAYYEGLVRLRTYPLNPQVDPGVVGPNAASR